jgi:hypothetical protein
MTHRLVVPALLISVSGLLAAPASAEMITSVSAAGPGRDGIVAGNRDDVLGRERRSI